MSNIYDDASLILYPSGYKASKLYSLKPTDGSGDLDVVRATTATRVNSDGLIEEVAINVPRIDYTGGGCGKLLLEPQRTNLQINSENASSDWGGVNGLDITANQIASPDGFENADLVAANSTTINHTFEKAFSATSGTSYSISYFAKANTNNQCFIFGYGDNAVFAGQIAVFNLTDGTIVSNTGGGIAKIENYGNGWYRVCLTLIAGSTATGFYGIGLAKNGLRQWTSDGTSIYMWGAQFEEGSYASSYIPTLAAAVTRGADACSKTGISSLIGQTEGTLFVEVDFSRTLQSEPILRHVFNVTDGTEANRVMIYIDSSGTNINAVIRANSALVVDTGVSAAGVTSAKIALAYKSGDYAMYVNGALTVSGTNAFAFSVALSQMNLGSRHTFTNELGDGANQALLFKTRLSNADLEALTA